jgi:class 3 adenylate cyclase
MFTDIVNFTDRSSSKSRHELLELLELHDSLVRPIFESFEGEIIKTMGDAFLVTFESPTGAVLCGMRKGSKIP